MKRCCPCLAAEECSHHPWQATIDGTEEWSGPCSYQSELRRERVQNIVEGRARTDCPLCGSREQRLHDSKVVDPPISLCWNCRERMAIDPPIKAFLIHNIEKLRQQAVRGAA